MDADEVEHNLRLFAMRQAAASREFSDLQNRVVVSVQSNPSRHCPQHGRHAHQAASAASSRKEHAKELRLAAAREAREARERSADQSYNGPRRGSAQRSSSLEPNYYNSMPRRMSASPASPVASKIINRNGSFQDQIHVKRDSFSPRVDFKTTLRQFNPKDDERSRGHLITASRSRHDSEPLDYHNSNPYFTQQLTAHNPYAQNPRRGTIMYGSEAGGPASLPIMPQKRPLKLELTSRSRPTTPSSLRSPESSRPQSPRRVEFADEVFFNFNTSQNLYQRSASTDLSLLNMKAKPILRNVHSDAGQQPRPQQQQPPRPLSLLEQYEYQQNQQQPLDLEPQPLFSPLVIEHANLDDKAILTSPASNDLAMNQRKLSNGSNHEDSLVQIYVPKSDEVTTDDDTLSAGSQDEAEDEAVTSEVKRKKSEVKRTISAEVTPMSSTGRKIPPALSDWNRSQSFPPPKASPKMLASEADEDGLLRKNSLPLSGSNVSMADECKNLLYLKISDMIFRETCESCYSCATCDCCDL
jgi:hypothetical protein